VPSFYDLGAARREGTAFEDVSPRVEPAVMGVQAVVNALERAAAARDLLADEQYVLANATYQDAAEKVREAREQFIFVRES